MPKKDFNKYLKEIRNNISNIYNQFYTFKALLNKENEKLYNRNKYFWGAITRSLGQSIILDLSKLFEELNKNKKLKYGGIISI